MPGPRTTSQWPLAGERNVPCLLSYATQSTDVIGGRRATTWTPFGRTWHAKITALDFAPNETDAVTTYEVEGPYRQDLVDYFNGGVVVRMKTPHLMLKVFLVSNPQERNRTLVCQCAKWKTQ